MFSFYLDNLEILLLLLRIVFVVVFAVRVILVSTKKSSLKKYLRANISGFLCVQASCVRLGILIIPKNLGRVSLSSFQIDGAGGGGERRLLGAW